MDLIRKWGEGAWHRQWKETLAPDRREIASGPHRADLTLGNGVVVEIQNSPISAAEIARREAHYKRMAWIFEASKFEIGFWETRIRRLGLGLNVYGKPLMFPCEEWTLLRDAFPPWQFLNTKTKFRWNRARQYVFACRKDTFLDLGSGHILRLDWSKPRCRTIYGTLFTKEYVVEQLRAK